MTLPRVVPQGGYDIGGYHMPAGVSIPLITTARGHHALLNLLIAFVFLSLSSASTLGLFIVARKSMAEMFTRFGLRGSAKGTIATCTISSLPLDPELECALVEVGLASIEFKGSANSLA
ncbi:hypothetical protein CPAR01_16197 [Colletotrichum paranaense]|uniref:Uncharacterized protein n=1 Tax=Colletotrichum paranaense TaxID=1914294 RepID=A0ABQ9RWY7_9PEZI|nr:uncharacterized protein CPAR01_16197 [Colletotrichum paranaense]KAK1517333.1 hypothetical protein CPAR01_16197 [Colletotrichum paranaense]